MKIVRRSSGLEVLCMGFGGLALYVAWVVLSCCNALSSGNPFDARGINLNCFAELVDR